MKAAGHEFELGAEEEQVLSRLLGIGNGSPVATPEMLLAGFRWLYCKVRRELREQPGGRGGQEWGRVSDIMRLYGVSRGQANAWLVRLRAEGKVRVAYPISGASGRGDAYYFLADVAAAFEDNARRGRGCGAAGMDCAGSRK